MNIVVYKKLASHRKGYGFLIKRELTCTESIKQFGKLYRVLEYRIRLMGFLNLYVSMVKQYLIINFQNIIKVAFASIK